MPSVALHPEGVDRNDEFQSEQNHYCDKSPSTRRAWIEIPTFVRELSLSTVALHPEGVDRNLYILVISEKYASSPSTRRAWIEIFV